MSTGPGGDPRYEPTMMNPSEFVDGDTPIRFPERLDEEYEIVGQLPRGGEAVLLVRARSRADGREVVLKLYRESLADRTEVLAAIQGRELAHVAQLLDFGSVDGVGYEVLEWIPGGDLVAFVDDHGGRLSEEIAESVVRELAAAVHAFHQLLPSGLAHGDLKPGNILVRSARPLDLVLADFGRATFDATKVSTVPNTTPRWSPPEDIVASPEGDWWRVGCLVQFCLTGEVPFPGQSEAAAVKLRSSRQFPLAALPDGLSRDWSRPLKGLLTRDYVRRWGHDEVTAWLDGAEVPLPPEWVEPAHVVVAAPTLPATEPIRFDDRDYHSIAEFAVGLAQGWDRATDLLATPKGSAALAEALSDYAADIHDLDLATEADHLQDQSISPERRLAELVTGLDPSLPPTFRRLDVSWHGLAALADDAAGHPSGDAAAAVTALAESVALPGYAGSSGGGDYGALHRDWDREIARWLAHMRAHGGDPTGEQWLVARARVLAALVEARARDRLTRDARQAGGRAARRTEWFRVLQLDATSPGTAAAAVMLAPAASAASRQAEAKRAAAAETQARERDAAATLRWPRTVRCLRWAVAPLVVLLVGTVMWHLLPQWDVASFVPPNDEVQWWTRWAPSEITPWLAAVTSPAIVLPPLVAAVVLLVRSRGAGSPRFVARHPLERRAMQAVVLDVSVLVPPLLPVTLLGWVAGLRRYCPEELYPRRAIRTASLLAGGAGATTAALLLWQVPMVIVWQSSWSWSWRVLDALTKAGLEHLADPWTVAVAGLEGADSSSYLTVTLLLCALAVASVGLGGLDYVRRTTAGTVAMWLLLLPSTVLALNGLLAYGLVGQNVFVDLAWVVVIVLLVRHRWRTRARQREAAR